MIGLGSFGMIYWRLRSDFTPENTAIIREAVLSPSSLIFILLAIVLFPFNWLIEAFKWMLITEQTEKISLKTASKSVYAGVCIGNLAPGRATEFLAKIHFFKAENKLTVTVLHFVNGMFQLSITIFFGMLAIFLKSAQGEMKDLGLNTVAMILSVTVMLVFVVILFNINRFVSWIYIRFNKDNYADLKPIVWRKKLLVQLFGFSIIRYLVFAFQFLLLLNVFPTSATYLQMFAGICIYFLFTTIIPMFSVIEAAVRTAIALVVFSGFGISDSALALVAVLLWLINIVFPSIVGYLVLLKENLSFKSFSLKKTDKA